MPDYKTSMVSYQNILSHMSDRKIQDVCIDFSKISIQNVIKVVTEMKISEEMKFIFRLDAVHEEEMRPLCLAALMGDHIIRIEKAPHIGYFFQENPLSAKDMYDNINAVIKDGFKDNMTVSFIDYEYCNTRGKRYRLKEIKREETQLATEFFWRGKSTGELNGLMNKYAEINEYVYELEGEERLDARTLLGLYN